MDTKNTISNFDDIVRTRQTLGFYIIKWCAYFQHFVLNIPVDSEQFRIALLLQTQVSFNNGPWKSLTKKDIEDLEKLL